MALFIPKIPEVNLELPNQRLADFLPWWQESSWTIFSLFPVMKVDTVNKIYFSYILYILTYKSHFLFSEIKTKIECDLYAG